MDGINSRYKYFLGSPQFHESSLVRDIIIPYWKKYWTALLKELDSPEQLHQDEYYWQNRITCILDGNTVVAMHFIASYESESIVNSEYAKRYLPDEVLGELFMAGRINTLQYMTVNPNYNYRKTQINFAGILADLSGLHHKDLTADQSITVARKAVGIHNLARKVGFREYCCAKKHGVQVSVMYMDKPKRHPDKKVRQISDYLWNNRNYLMTREQAA